MTATSLNSLVALARAAAEEAANYQERFGAQDLEARKIVDILERFLRIKGRMVYGGAAINAHLPADRKFYDPSLYLPDYDFMTPDPLQDCADLIATFQDEGFIDVEAKFGIHEGTYKIFVNYRAAADITYMPPDIYEQVIKDSEIIDGIRYASADFLRMNIYLELSRPAGDVSRWEKVYKRLLLLNEVRPIRAGRCSAAPLDDLAASETNADTSSALYDAIVQAGIEVGAIFLSGIPYIRGVLPNMRDPVMMIADNPAPLLAALKALHLKSTTFPAIGELLPARVEFRTSRKRLVAVVFDAVACHAYSELDAPPEYRMASLDLLIQMYYALYFAGLQNYVSVRLLCVVRELIEMEITTRQAAAKKGNVGAAFSLQCIGHQPTLPELKKAHRVRVQEKRKELKYALRNTSGIQITRRQKHRG